MIRPTGIVDPPITVKPTKGQVEDLVAQVKRRVKRNERVLVTTLTKRMSEDLSQYLEEQGLKVKYLHSDIETIDRVQVLKDLRTKKVDCLVGVNLLREGLDLPEVSLVAIFDADKEGFLRSQTSLIQVAGRAARNINGEVIMYADKITPAMKSTIGECERRRRIQLAFNKKHHITPRTIEKAVREGIEQLAEAEEVVMESAGLSEEAYAYSNLISDLERQMELAARNLQFEKAALLRDKIHGLKDEGSFAYNRKDLPPKGNRRKETIN
jgi:excinuclease ABC subunit B